MNSHAPVRHLLALALLTGVLFSPAVGQEQKPAAPASAQPKNFSGTWKMNAAKSKFGADDAPQAITVTFGQHGQNLSEVLTIAGSGGEERKLELKFTLDGKEGTNQLGGEQIKSTAKMEGDALVIELQGRQGPFRRRFTLSEDGKVMTILVNRSEGGAEKTDTIMLDKQ